MSRSTNDEQIVNVDLRTLHVTRMQHRRLSGNRIGDRLRDNLRVSVERVIDNKCFHRLPPNQVNKEAGDSTVTLCRKSLWLAAKVSIPTASKAKDNRSSVSLAINSNHSGVSGVIRFAANPTPKCAGSTSYFL